MQPWSNHNSSMFLQQNIVSSCSLSNSWFCSKQTSLVLLSIDSRNLDPKTFRTSSLPRPHFISPIFGIVAHAVPSRVLQEPGCFLLPLLCDDGCDCFCFPGRELVRTTCVSSSPIVEGASRPSSSSSKMLSTCIALHHLQRPNFSLIPCDITDCFNI